MQATDRLVVLLQRVRHHQHISVQPCRFVRHQTQDQVLDVGLLMLVLELEAFLAEVADSDEIAAL